MGVVRTGMYQPFSDPPASKRNHPPIAFSVPLKPGFALQRNNSSGLLHDGGTPEQQKGRLHLLI